MLHRSIAKYFLLLLDIYIQKGYLEINRILQKCSMIEVLLFSQIQPSLFFPLILKVKTLVATAISKVKKEVSELFFFPHTKILCVMIERDVSQIGR